MPAYDQVLAPLAESAHKKRVHKPGLFIIRRVALSGELHLPHNRMRQQLLPILPEQLLPHLWFELNLDRLEILHPALRRDEGIVGAEEEAVLQARGGFPEQTVWNETW